MTVKKARNPRGKLRFNTCPQCGQKGFYHVPRQYCRCRYCGLCYLMLPGQDF